MRLMVKIPLAIICAITALSVVAFFWWVEREINWQLFYRQKIQNCDCDCGRKP